jgi:DNA-binding transcriptional MerR regulator
MRTSSLIGSLVNTTEAAESAGITVRQLDHWARTEIVTPVATPMRGQGKHRLWTVPEIKTLRVLGSLADLGVPLRVLAAAARALEDVTVEPGDRRLLVVTPKGDAFIAADHAELSKLGLDSCWSVKLAVANREVA